MWKLILMILFAWTLTGCGSGPQPTPAISRPVPANLMVDCPPPPPAPTTFRGADLLVNHVVALRAYHDCRQLHRGLVEWVRNPARPPASSNHSGE